MKIAIVHDFLTQSGGAERVVEAFHRIWPEAPIYTSVYDPKGTFPSFAQMDVRTSFLQRVPFAATNRHHKKFLTLFPMAFEMLDLRGYDVVISNNTSFAKGVITYPETCHISYCHTPMRFAWRYAEYVEQGSFGGFERSVMPFVIHRLRAWDWQAAQRVDYFLGNSHNIVRRIQKFYGRTADVLYPPVDTSRFQPTNNPDSDYLLVVSRFLSYKRVDLAVEAATRLGMRLKVVGSGPDEARLRALAGPTVEFLGKLPDGQVESLFANCSAFLFPGEEDFGIAPVEAMAAGRPVIAYRAGGAMETVAEGLSGLFFDEPTVESLMGAIRRLDTLSVDAQRIRAHAETFGHDRFRERLQHLVARYMADYRSRHGGFARKP
ncbi:MAG: glycosyltransferase [Armatimonadota bacterium]